MQPISVNPDLSSILQLNQFSLQVNTPQLTPVSGDISQSLLNDIAASADNISAVSSNFDMAMNDLASYKDIISSAQDSISKMRNDGQSIKDIVAQAQQGNLSQEMIDKLQSEVNEKILDISIIKEAAENSGVNTNGSNTIDIKSTEALMETTGSGATNPMSNGMTAFDLDLSFDLDGISFDGSAKIAMGKGADGSLQFAFDVTLNYDLSALSTEGITSPNAPDVINNFMNMLDSQDGILSKASKIVDSAFEKIFDSMNSSLGGQNNYIDSSVLSKQMVQQPTSILDSIMMNQMPGIAMGLL